MSGEITSYFVGEDVPKSWYKITPFNEGEKLSSYQDRSVKFIRDCQALNIHGKVFVAPVTDSSAQVISISGVFSCNIRFSCRVRRGPLDHALSYYYRDLLEEPEEIISGPH